MQESSVDDISGWAGRIDTLISALPQSIVSRVVVIESTDSTQDAAIRFAQGEPGLLVVASRQNNGRGTKGRRWDDGNRATLPCTFILSACCADVIKLSACVACAVHETISAFVPRTVRIGIKWPNDIVVCDDHTERKIAGTLIEKRDGMTLAGIGINCTQVDRDWSEAFADRAVSFAGLGVKVSRFDLLCQLVTSLSEWLTACDEHAIRSYYEHFNAMIGTTRSFRHNQREFRGIVEHIDPFESILLGTHSGYETLPIAQTQHVRNEHDEG
jgi:BirA family biotin operon repressor/biotin-[acetyl-CoA-carboxylase] ligase